MDTGDFRIAPSRKTCPKCGVGFECRGEEDCWCESYQILQKDFIRLSRSYTDCLCPDCLKEYTTD